MDRDRKSSGKKAETLSEGRETFRQAERRRGRAYRQSRRADRQRDAPTGREYLYRQAGRRADWQRILADRQ
jgi:hypothetical protein